ncbi:DNA/RNA non-specific endonuclease [Brevibacillus composti]|uniref:DNA/RNA non-specific endonuclease n=1 Tax=Brevibacillus composti TaxID=2796470 RepID=A0A7T5JQV8_9BACL|nr:DNA/RNA non-specific endonuclease [Brevibacillus composti]QUO43663.1 DNA/RNA non-specific endonuclease [Brevibacillus composti]
MNLKAVPHLRAASFFRLVTKYRHALQIGNEFYRQNDYDKGHLTRRKDICWGTYEEAARANYDSFCYANIALQHHSFNTGIWNCLEDWILSRMKEPNRLLVYTGPILKEEDEEYCGVQGEPGCQVKVPFGFWKTVFFLQENTEITCLSFLIRQTPDRLQGDCGYQRLATYQVPLSTITEQAEVNFRPELYERNPLLVRAVDADRRGETKRPIRQEAVVINNLEDIRLA